MAHAGSPSSMTSSPQCSICLEVVLDNQGRSTARLQCGHVFHLDCIGSSFNFRGLMQCPNCRTTENGDWLHATRGSEQEQRINEEEDNPINQIEEDPPATQWLPFTGLLGTLRPVGESLFTLAANTVAGDVFIVSSDSLPDPNLVLPLNGHQGAVGFPLSSSINDLQLQQQNWVPQAPLPTMDNTTTVAIQASSSSEIAESVGMVSYGGPCQGLLASTIYNGSSAGNQGSLGISFGSLVPSSNVPSLTRFQVASQQPQINWPSPPVLASMLIHTGGVSMNLPSLDVQVGDLNTVPSSEIFIGNASDEVLLLSGPENDGMQLGPTFENMPPEDETDGHGFTMFQFL